MVSLKDVTREIKNNKTNIAMPHTILLLFLHAKNKIQHRILSFHLLKFSQQQENSW